MFIKIEEKYNGPFVMKNGKAFLPDKKISKIINLMNADSIIFQNENFGALNIIFNDKTITIDNVSIVEWQRLKKH